MNVIDVEEEGFNLGAGFARNANESLLQARRAGTSSAGGVSRMALGLQSSRHFPSAVALETCEMADGTRSVPATFEVNQVPFG